MAPKKRVLFVCTGSSARSQLAEGLLRHISKGEVDSFSAGTEPQPVNPLAVRVMSEGGIDISGQRSRSVATFASESFDFVITVCDRAKEKCPRWPGQVDYIHWSIADPARVEGSEDDRLRAFRKAREELRQRITLFLLANRIGSLPGSHARR
jgi:arsenate reductase (thioredoxin)